MEYKKEKIMNVIFLVDILGAWFFGLVGIIYLLDKVLGVSEIIIMIGSFSISFLFVCLSRVVWNKWKYVIPRNNNPNV